MKIYRKHSRVITNLLAIVVCGGMSIGANWALGQNVQTPIKRPSELVKFVKDFAPSAVASSRSNEFKEAVNSILDKYQQSTKENDPLLTKEKDDELFFSLQMCLADFKILDGNHLYASTMKYIERIQPKENPDRFVRFSIKEMEFWRDSEGKIRHPKDYTSKRQSASLNNYWLNPIQVMDHCKSRKTIEAYFSWDMENLPYLVQAAKMDYGFGNGNQGDTTLSGTYKSLLENANLIIKYHTVVKEAARLKLARFENDVTSADTHFRNGRAALISLRNTLSSGKPAVRSNFGGTFDSGFSGFENSGFGNSGTTYSSGAHAGAERARWKAMRNFRKNTSGTTGSLGLYWDR